MKELKHFNAGHVWGKILKAEEKETKDKHTPFVELEIDCGHPEHGNVRAYGRLWGKEKCAAFMDYLKDHKDFIFRFKGYYGQYVDHDKRYSSYTFYDFIRPDEIIKTGTKNNEPRAAFILTGELAEKELDADADPRLMINVVRSGKETSSENSLEVFLFELDGFYDIEPGDLIEVRGVLRKRSAEDFYGGSTDDAIKPYVMFLKKRRSGEKSAI